MRNINHDRRAVAIGLVGMVVLSVAVYLLDGVDRRIGRRTEKAETVLSSMEDYRKDGVRAFLEDGRVTVYGGRKFTTESSVYAITPEAREEGPYVITNNSDSWRGPWESWTFQYKEDAMKWLTEIGSGRGSIKVFRSYRIDPEELERK